MASSPVVRVVSFVLLGAIALLATACERAPAEPPAPPPSRLSATGLYLPGAVGRVDPRNLAYRPRYPLWTDGVAKRRWVRLPDGTSIDGSSPDAWRLPPGTRLWKEFAIGRPVETRMLECLPDGAWRYATYHWRDDGSDADLVSPGGYPDAASVAPGVPFDIPSHADCRACHESGRGPVLGFNAFQLTRPDGAREADGVTLAELIARGLLRGHPADAVHPLDTHGIAPRTRDVLGYLAGNCAHCHDAQGVLHGLGLVLATSWRDDACDLPPLRTTLDVPLHRAPGLRLVPGHPEASDLLRRMASRVPDTQMPPLGTHRVDDRALQLFASWIREDLAAPVPSLAPSSSEKHP